MSERWLAALWPAVRDRLPPPPARVVDLGCGSEGGFVPMLAADGYDAIGVDPRAPDGDRYRRAAFEDAGLPGAADAVIASTSLHHVADPTVVVERVAGALAPGGTLVVVEWDWEAFDEQTARWCFDRLGPDTAAGWLHHRRDEWRASAAPWADYLRGWAQAHGIHPVGAVLDALDGRFQRVHAATGPYFFGDLAGVTEDDERAAIAAGEIRAARVDYAGRLLSSAG